MESSKGLHSFQFSPSDLLQIKGILKLSDSDFSKLSYEEIRETLISYNPFKEMPYNTTAIPPRREPTGSTQLPLSRVRKMIAIDQDINLCSNTAGFVITLATELFVQYLAESAHNVVKSERKPRRNIQYRDISSAVSHLDNLEFLVDVVPKTVPFKEVKERKTTAGPKINGESSVEPGQTTLDGKKPAVNGTNGLEHAGPSGTAGEDDPNAQLEMEMEIRGARASVGSSSGYGGKEPSQDVEMH